MEMIKPLKWKLKDNQTNEDEAYLDNYTLIIDSCLMKRIPYREHVTGSFDQARRHPAINRGIPLPFLEPV